MTMSENVKEQPEKLDAMDLSYLYDFICDCPNPKISTAMRALVDRWLIGVETLPQFSEAMKKQLEAADADVIEICWLLSINPKTPPAVLNDLCSGAESDLLQRIAGNSNTGSSTLAQLSYQAVAEIRIATASNPNTPLASIMMLVKDENSDVRFSIAENQHVPEEALLALSHDENPYVKLRATTTLALAEIRRDIFG